MAPAWSDEFAYVAEARSLVLNKNLHAPHMIDESVARIGQLGSHGLGYAIIDGAAALTGWKWNFKILANIIMLGLAAAIAVRGDSVRRNRRSVVLLILLTGYILPLYLFSYMQEVTQVLLSACFFRLYMQSEREPLGFRSLVLLAICCSFAMLLRSIWAFVMISAVLITSRRHRWTAIGLTGILIVLAPLENSLMQAVFPDAFLPRAVSVLRAQGGAAFVKVMVGHLQQNLEAYFSQRTGGNWAYLAHKYWMFTLFLGCVWGGWKARLRPVLAAGVLGIVTWTAVCVLYDVFDWREQRVLAPCALVAALTAGAVAPWRYAVAVAGVTITFGAAAFLTTVPDCIRQHQAAATSYQLQHEKVRAFEALGDYLPESRENVILVPPAVVNDTVAVLSLPLRGPRSQQIRYTSNYFAKDAQEQFKRRGLLPIEYAVVVRTGPLREFPRVGTPVHEGEYYSLQRFRQPD